MRRETKKAAAAVCMIGLLTAAGSICAFAQSPTLTAGSSAVELNAGGPAGERETTAPEKIRIWGTVTSVEENRIVLNNQSGASFEGEMVLHISDETTKVLGAVDGLPLSLSDIHVGDSVYAYIGPAMTLSLPPQTAAEMIIAGIPADFKVPEYITVDSMTWNEDTSWTLVSSEGTTYQIPGECPVIPYLTRQMVYLPDVTEGRELLIWSNAENVGQRLVLFNE